MIAYGIEPKTADYMFAGHSSVEIGQKAMLKKMGLSPILDFNLRLGEGTGAALAMLMIEAGRRSTVRWRRSARPEFRMRS